MALALRDLFELLDFSGEHIILTGGGGQNPFWAQMIADVLQKQIVVPNGTQFGARGAALLIATALGHFANIRMASRAVSGGGKTYTSDRSTRAAYEAAFRRYRGHRDRLLND